MIEHKAPQGTAEWFAARRGIPTGSRIKDARDRKKNGEPSEKMLGYAKDLARERNGGKVGAKFQSAPMAIGKHEEPLARIAYEIRTGYLVEEVGFFTTDDGSVGVSPDGLVDDDGIIEIKAMVASNTLFEALVDGDISEYYDQCLTELMVLDRQWCDLVLWAPDFEFMVVHRIERSETEFAELRKDLEAFEMLVRHYEDALTVALSEARYVVDAAESEPALNAGFTPPPIPAPTPAPAPKAPRAIAPPVIAFEF